MDFKDYYSVLGVAENADKKSIKTAYRKLARKYHPDVSEHINAEDKFKEAVEAYEVLKDSEKRAEYDALREHKANGNSFTPPPGWNSGSSHDGECGSSEGDFSDFFRAAFGGGHSEFYTQQEGREQFQHRGRDVQIDMPIFLEDTLGETHKPLAYHLNGENRNLNVTIPAGVADGELIRLKGQGETGLNGAPNGHLYLRIRIVPHPLFDVEHNDLIITVPLAPWEAALGAKLEIPTITGKIRLTISPNSQTGQRLRIRGQGLVHGTARGNLYAVLKIVIPDKSNEIVKKQWQQLSEEASFDPRSEWSKSA
ncbi:MAG: curved DNA-binding protein [Halioglobus sp.]|jgi:curved DNA-binding protein